MRIYKIKITMPDGAKWKRLGMYADGFEAVLQTMADYPTACGISCIRLLKGGAL